MANPDDTGVVVDFSRFSGLRERHRAFLARQPRAAMPSAGVIEGQVVAAADARIVPVVARADIDPELRPGPARRGKPWGADGLRPLPPRP